MEGFADWFAQAVARNDPGAGLAGTTGGGGGTSSVSTLESPACSPITGVTGDAVENFVAGVLWDLSDPVGTGPEAADAQANNETIIFQSMDRELDVAPHGGPWPSVYGFRNAWLARGHIAATIDPILQTLNRVPLPTPAPGGGGSGGPSEEVCDKRPWLPGCR